MANKWANRLGTELGESLETGFNVFQYIGATMMRSPYWLIAMILLFGFYKGKGKVKLWKIFEFQG